MICIVKTQHPYYNRLINSTRGLIPDEPSIVCIPPLSFMHFSLTGVCQEETPATGIEQWESKVQKYQEKQKEIEASGLLDTYTMASIHGDTRSIIYDQQDFKTAESRLEKQFSEISTPMERYYYSWHISHIGNFKYGEDPRKILRTLNLWVKNSPNHYLPYLIRGDFYINYAWYFRGGYYMSKVSQEARDKMIECIEYADKDLRKAISLNPKDPEAMFKMMSTSKSLGHGLKGIALWYQKVIDIDPLHYFARNSLMNLLQPKWFGSWEMVESFIEDCEKHSKDFPYLLMINRTAANNMRARGTKFESAWDKSDSKWLQAALDQYGLSDGDPYLAMEVIYMAMSANDKKTVAKFSEIVGDTYYIEARFQDLESYSTYRGRNLAKAARFDDIRGTPQEIELLKQAIRYAPQDIRPLNDLLRILKKMLFESPNDQTLKMDVEHYARIQYEVRKRNATSPEMLDKIKLHSSPVDYSKVSQKFKEIKGYIDNNQKRYTEEGLFDLYTIDSIFKNFTDVLYIKKEFERVHSRILKDFNKATSPIDHYVYNEFIEYMAYPNFDLSPEQHIKILDEWVQLQPDSYIPYLIRGYFYQTISTFQMGTKKRSISYQHRDEFYYFTKLSHADFVKAYELNPNDPTVSVGLLSSGYRLGQQREQLDSYFKQAIDIEPHHFRAHLEYMESCFPLWNGTWEEVEKFEKICMDRGNAFPMLKYIARRSYEEMSRRTPQLKNRWKESVDMWAEASLEQYKQDKKNTILLFQYLQIGGNKWSTVT